MSAPSADDVDDLYGTPSANTTPALQTASAISYIDAKQPSASQAQPAGIPGLGMFTSPVSSAVPQVQHAQPQQHAQIKIEENSPAQHTSPDQSLPHPGAASSEPASSAAQPAPRDATSALFDALGNNHDMNKNLPNPPSNETPSASASAPSKPPVDPEFLEAAQAQKSEQNAEWQYDSSDAESSSDDSSSDDSSSDDEDDSDEGYELLDPATAARMLMEEGAMDGEDGANRSSNQAHLRTKNEQPEEIIPKPDVTVTPDMKITPLGLVQHIVDNLILVKAFNTGEYQVLESGSVLCLENREVIGAVQDTLGKVEEPLYSVAFTKPSDITDLGITTDTKLFYVNAHSTYVFTEPLKGMKGTDASNLHDEEVAEDEMEFSDDEAESNYKKAKKEAKKNARAVQHQPNQPPAPKPYTGGAISYDDEPETEEMYTPLARPDNLQEMMTGGAPPPRRPFADRGRGRGRGRGDRGRGDRGRGGRGGRGGADISNQRKGHSNSYPDSHNSQTPAYAQQSLPQKPAVSQQMQQMPQMQQMWPQGQPQSNAQFAFPQFGQQQFPPPPPPPQVQAGFANMPFAWPQNQQFFNQAQQQQPFQFPGVPSTPGGNIPAGAFVNPAFFQQQQQHQGQQQQQAPMTSAAPVPAQSSGPSPEAIKAAQDLWHRLQQQLQ